MTEKEAIVRLKQGDIDGLEFLVRCHQTDALREIFPFEPSTTEETSQVFITGLEGNEGEHVY
jgi:hypothetical protein